MSLNAPSLASQRAARDRAKAGLARRVDQLRTDLEARSIPGRIADRVMGDAAETAVEAMEVVRTNRAVVAGTLAALTAWVLRHPIIALIRRMAGITDAEEEFHW